MAPYGAWHKGFLTGITIGSVCTVAGLGEMGDNAAYPATLILVVVAVTFMINYKDGGI